MSRPRIFTDDECAVLAAWWATARSVRAKADELGCSESALYDAIARGQGRMTNGERVKLRGYERPSALVPRESPQSEGKPRELTTTEDTA